MTIASLKRLITPVIITTVLPLFLTGCATYKSSFNCGDAKGAYCASMDYVDQMINSGEIEQFNERRLNKKYKQPKSSVIPLKVEVDPARITHFEDGDARD